MTANEQSSVLTATGRIAAARQLAREWVQRSVETGQPSRALGIATWAAELEARYGRKDEALRQLDQNLARFPLDSMDRDSRPYDALVRTYALAGRPDLGRRLLAQQAAAIPAPLLEGDFGRHQAQGVVALAEGKYSEAIASFRRFNDLTGCGPCGLYGVADAFDRMGLPDSARIYYQRALETPALHRFGLDATTLAPALKRLGELYEARGDKANAAKYYGKFVDLWQQADPELQPTVRDVRTRLAQLNAEGGG